MALLGDFSISKFGQLKQRGELISPWVLLDEARRQGVPNGFEMALRLTAQAFLIKAHAKHMARRALGHWW
jgi:hypothetical protein